MDYFKYYQKLRDEMLVEQGQVVIEKSEPEKPDTKCLKPNRFETIYDLAEFFTEYCKTFLPWMGDAWYEIRETKGVYMVTYNQPSVMEEPTRSDVWDESDVQSALKRAQSAWDAAGGTFTDSEDYDALFDSMHVSAF